VSPPRLPPRPAPKPNRPPALELRPGETGEPTPYRRRQDTLRGPGPVPPAHVAAAREAARESRPEPSLTPEQSQLQLYRKRAETAERELREARDRQSRSATPPGVSVAPPALDDAAVGKLVKASVNALARKIGLPAVLVAMLGLGGAGYKVATDKPAPPALTAAELDARLDKLKTRKGGLDDLVRATNEGLQLSKCLRRKVNEIGGALLPAPDRMGPARRPAPYEDDCQDSPRPLPEP
jgi:hypothetical protein